ncbi:hypothetical protein AOQ84DRAFT_387080 [Glonium stellatum]|uniref:Uncharacterized protein n=1 Tax=Glonium stellatum TaxID=574774 RepID=A0A8E2F5Z1_9PEZI|nr:hypothetical protein AOQ84DRAFT_387080 [Glonium stellatum]
MFRFYTLPLPPSLSLAIQTHPHTFTHNMTFNTIPPSPFEKGNGCNLSDEIDGNINEISISLGRSNSASTARWYPNSTPTPASPLIHSGLLGQPNETYWLNPLAGSASPSPPLSLSALGPASASTTYNCYSVSVSLPEIQHYSIPTDFEYELGSIPAIRESPNSSTTPTPDPPDDGSLEQVGIL